MKHWLRKLLSVCCALLLCGFATAQEDEARSAWTPRTLEVAGKLIVQDGGRLKPLSTLANFTLLRISGRRSYTDKDGEKHGAVEFLLDTIYFPKQAADAPVFLINDSNVAQALELKLPEKKKRDRYTFHELEVGLQKLFTLAHQYAAIDAKQRNSVQGEIVLLAERVDAFLRLNRQETIALIPPDDQSQGEAATQWLAPAWALARISRGEQPSSARAQVCRPTSSS